MILINCNFIKFYLILIDDDELRASNLLFIENEIMKDDAVTLCTYPVIHIQLGMRICSRILPSGLCMDIFYGIYMYVAIFIYRYIVSGFFVKKIKHFYAY